ncbi:hypothetical protein ACJMK2_011157 [Sinanodonta woodiana]|uniref:Clathrin heavy chain n=1 Tax=Sinanodonta woodiana TaxID=1069815 RepID=A0ABD3V758_SINWO
MAVQGPPITINELIQLTNVGVPLDQVTWSRVTLTSDKWIAVRHGNKEDNKRSMALGTKDGTDAGIPVTVLSPKDGSISYAGQTTADFVLMNPSEPVIALKAGLRLEVFNVETKSMITKTRMDDPLMYWTWVSSDYIAMVTDHAVYHWNPWLKSGPYSQPEKMFVRHPRLAFSEIVAYKADPSLKWLAVTGLTPEDDKISGVTQLYNTDEDVTQCIASHAVCFAPYRFHDNATKSTILCVATRDVQNHGKVHVIELGPYIPGNFAPRNSYDHIQYLDDKDHYDFPMAVHVSADVGLLFVLTKYGYLYLCDMETASCLCFTRVSMDVIFTSTLNTITQGILGVTRGGQVITVDIKKDGLIDYVRDTAKKSNQADRLERTIAIPVSASNTH